MMKQLCPWRSIKQLHSLILLPCVLPLQTAFTLPSPRVWPNGRESGRFRSLTVLPSSSSPLCPPWQQGECVCVCVSIYLVVGLSGACSLFLGAFDGCPQPVMMQAGFLRDASDYRLMLPPPPPVSSKALSIKGMVDGQHVGSLWSLDNHRKMVSSQQDLNSEP